MLFTCFLSIGFGFWRCESLMFFPSLPLRGKSLNILISTPTGYKSELITISLSHDQIVILNESERAPLYLVEFTTLILYIFTFDETR